MAETESPLSQVRKIDNTKGGLPWITTILLIFLIALFIWFFRGGSFRLYASLFFSLYYLTHQIWLSVLLIGILQNILFIPLRIIGNIVDQSLKDFEEELETFASIQLSSPCQISEIISLKGNSPKKKLTINATLELPQAKVFVEAGKKVKIPVRFYSTGANTLSQGEINSLRFNLV